MIAAQDPHLRTSKEGTCLISFIYHFAVILTPSFSMSSGPHFPTYTQQPMILPHVFAFSSKNCTPNRSYLLDIGSDLTLGFLGLGLDGTALGPPKPIVSCVSSTSSSASSSPSTPSSSHSIAATFLFTMARSHLRLLPAVPVFCLYSLRSHFLLQSRPSRRLLYT